MRLVINLIWHKVSSAAPRERKDIVTLDTDRHVSSSSEFVAMEPSLSNCPRWPLILQEGPSTIWQSLFLILPS